MLFCFVQGWGAAGPAWPDGAGRVHATIVRYYGLMIGNVFCGEERLWRAGEGQLRIPRLPAVARDDRGCGEGGGLPPKPQRARLGWGNRGGMAEAVPFLGVGIEVCAFPGPRSGTWGTRLWCAGEEQLRIPRLPAVARDDRGWGKGGGFPPKPQRARLGWGNRRQMHSTERVYPSWPASGLSNLVNLEMKLRWTVPVGPLRCLAMMISDLAFSDSDCSSSRL